MTASYSGNPATSPLDAVRFLVGDTDPCQFFLQDAEVNYLLAQYNNAVPNTAIPYCYRIIAKLTRLADESVGQVKIQYSQKAKAFRTMIQDLRNQLATFDITPYAGGIAVSDVTSVNCNANRVRPDFTKNMMVNRQEGGWLTGNGGLWDGGPGWGGYWYDGFS